MLCKVLLAFALASVSHAIWPHGIMPGESAALDFIMRVSRLTSSDLAYIHKLQYWGHDDDEILEKARNDDPNIYEKMVYFLDKYNKLSRDAKDYVDDVFQMAMNHTNSYQREQYYTAEQIAQAIRLVGKLKDLPIHAELTKVFPDINARPPLLK